ncbi:MAG: Ig domain-containing protein [Agathobacter sp.]|nr:Ig domain-containing protein [Agathobacter sp.]
MYIRITILWLKYEQEENYMKNILRKIFIILLCLVLILPMIPSEYVDAASKVKLNKTKMTLYIGKTQTLKITGTSKKVKWSSSNKKIATVSTKGKVIAKKEGKVTITAKVGGKKYKCSVTVKKPYINTTKKLLYVNKTYTLKLTGTEIKSVKSSNKKVATVTKKGKVTAKGDGKATITLTGKDGKKYTFKLTVVGPYNGYTQWNENPEETNDACLYAYIVFINEGILTEGQVCNEIIYGNNLTEQGLRDLISAGYLHDYIDVLIYADRLPEDYNLSVDR